MSRTIRFGIVGCGVIAPFHAEAILATSGAELAAVCDIIGEKASSFASNYGVDKVYSDYARMLEDTEIDAVCICTPSGLHGEMAIGAARAGKHIFCEKPVEITRSKLDAMIEEVERCGVKMGCVFQRRTFPESIAVKKALNEGTFGKVILADAYLKYYRSPEYYRSAGWRATWELDGGGALMNQGVHGIDLVAWLAGDVESVLARTATQVHNIPVEDTAIAVIKYCNGALGAIEGTTSVYPAQSTRLEIHCEKGSVVLGDDGITQWAVKDRPEEKAPAIQGTGISAKDDPKKIANSSHFALMADFVDAIVNDRPPLIPPREARKAVDVILAIYESAKTGKEVRLR